MAVTVTPRDLIEASYAKSTKSSPGAIATESTELLNLVNRTVRKFYIIAARVNPTYFADITQVAAPGAATPWARPEGAESVFRLETGGDLVVVVPFDDRNAEAGIAAVYRMGKNYYTCGNVNDPDPSSDPLDFWYSKRPDDAADLDTALDATWEEQFNEMLVLELALYLANKDGRPEELPQLIRDRDDWLRMFIMFLEHETANERRRFGHVRRFNTMSLVPITDLLAGGSTVDLNRGSD